MVEHYLSDIPTRLNHVYQPIAYAIAYTVFSVVLWSQTGVVIYEYVLDWGSFITIGTVIGMLAYFFVFQLMAYLIYLRKQHCCG